MKYLVIYEKTETGYSAYIPDLPGCVSTGATKKQVEENIYEAMKFHLEGLREDGIPLPEQQSESEMLAFA
jgi:predicted RNase H-like HicB family nuclease